MKLDTTKPVETREGRPARIVCKDDGTAWPIIAMIMNAGGTEWPHKHSADGACASRCTEQDLVNVPEKRTLDVWLNRYPQYICPFAYPSEADADRGAGPDRIDCVHTVREYVVGEGMK